MKDDQFQIKRKPNSEIIQNDSKSGKHFGEDLVISPDKSKTVQKLKTPEINTDEIFQKIFEDASNDITIYRTLTSILHICRSELVI